MDIGGISVGDRVGYRDGTMPLGSDMVRRGTVTKVGRKYVTLVLDSGVYGGSSRRMLGSVTSEQKVLPWTLFRLTDERERDKA
ncbi:hypotheical protein [Mycobacterium phage PP]|uniref:Hypotheical protein n=1 Tax=Mycobacterium phage PP TaxID=2077134 RepID=A0A2Z5XVJ6_9CAUD|nr:hypothetical protein KIW36_gp17 [Mycobacterium phage PP]BBC53874.1 hypotheical protein [Mycobacterium phage PP]